MSDNTIISIDLAKNVFQVAILQGRTITSNKQYKRAALIKFIANTAPATIAMEACYSSHYWARECEKYGHRVLIVPAQHVKPFTRGNKTDANDAIAIIEASQRPNLRFVSVKSTHQQDIQSLHRIRERLVRNRTSLVNQTRGLLAEYGIVSKVGKKGFLLGIEDALNNEALSDILKHELSSTLNELHSITEHIKSIESHLRRYVENDPRCQLIYSIPGIGVINASALVCKFGNASQFSKARSLSCLLYTSDAADE